MRLFRMARRRFADDLSGTGARLAGGRWNSVGNSVLYTSMSISLALCEYLVNSKIKQSPADMCVITIEAPDDSLKTVSDPALLESRILTIDAGDKWIRSGETLCLKVPSKVVPLEFNVLVNPSHQMFGKIKVISIDGFSFDERFFS